MTLQDAADAAFVGFMICMAALLVFLLAELFLKRKK